MEFVCLTRSASNPVRLSERVRGPNAKPIAFLVAQGDVAARQTSSQFREFVRSRVEEIASLMDRLSSGAEEGGWQQLLDAIQDLRSSSETCGESEISRLAASWSALLLCGDKTDQRVLALMRLHQDAIRIAAAHPSRSEEMDVLARRMESAATWLNMDPTDSR